MRLVTRWCPGRQLVMVGDGAYASLDVFWALRGRAVCVARCRMDARFFNPPPPRRKGQKGRPRLIGTRQLTARTRAVRKATKWEHMTVPGWRTKDGRAEREVEVATGTALWSARGKTMPVRWVLTRDPAGRAETRVFVCSDPEQSALQILTWYAMRWAVETTFQEARRHLGFETQRQWSDRAIHRTTPLLLGCARRSWRGPAGGSPAQVRGSASLVASVALWKATTTAKRTQRSCGVCIEPRKQACRRGGDVPSRRTQHERCRHARHRRPAGVGDHITHEGTASEPGRPPAAHSGFGGCGPGREARKSVADPEGRRSRTAA